MGCGCSKKKKSNAKKTSKKTTNSTAKSIKKLPVVSTKVLKKAVKIKR